jgi:ABC-type branched-subunit amino acid transport system ATPase component
MTVPLLELDRVTAGYGAVTVLHELSLQVGPDEIVAVLGANGSGKSTVLKTAMGLTRMSGGSIRFAGSHLERLPAHRRAAAGLSYVPQVRNVFADLTVMDNLRMGAFLRPRSLAAEVGQVFELFPRLSERRTQLAGELSGGERRMLSIGLALLLRPKLLLLDEPSSDLAPALVETVFAAIRRIRDELRVPAILVEQNVRMALGLADRVVVLVRGREAAEMAPAGARMEDLHRLFLDGTSRPVPTREMS